MKHFTASLLLIFSLAVQASQYVGSDTCGTCHEEQYKAWMASDHRQAMLLPTEGSVRGRFAGESVNFHGRSTRFYREGNYFLIETETESGREQLPVAYTFGHYPLQQYLIERDKGHLQAFNVAWDDRSRERGGQRWFHLRDEMPKDSPFFWTRHLQNWNSGCADCHSTNLQLNYDESEKSYTTTFSEPNVGCEACHGPGAEHVTSAGQGAPFPMITLSSDLKWTYAEGQPVARASGDSNEDYVDMCGGCHSRRGVIGEVNPHGRFRDQYQQSLLGQGLYFADGQIDDEVFVLGSFMQSKMYEAGVTCMNCHEAHTGKVKYNDNRLCAQCHNPANYDRVVHAGHSAEQAMCVDCHMPERTYMVVDDRRDHRFGIPDPFLTRELGVPNACENCHSDKPVEWAIRNSPEIQDPYARLTTRARQFDPAVVPEAGAYIRSKEHPGIKRATLLATLPLTSDAYPLAAASLKDTAPMMRRAAVELLQAAPVAERYQLLVNLRNDPDKSVRLGVASALAQTVSQLPLEKARELLPGITELRSSMRPDTASGLTSLGMLDIRMGRRESAQDLLQAAIDKEPHYIPALLNLADIQRHQDEAAAMELLRRAVEVAPDSGAANHSYGLSLVRSGRTEDSLVYLGLATEQFDAVPRYAYVYAVALDSVGKTREALELLSQSLQKWPDQADLINLQVAYQEKTQ